jgi:hypothetical protein
MMRAMTKYVACALVVVGCGGGAKQEPAHPKFERTVDQWTTGDEDRYIGLACTNVISPSRTLRCDSLVKAGLTPDLCRATLADWRKSAPAAGPKRKAFRMLLAGLALADSCDMINASFLVASRAANADGRQQAAAAGCPMRDDNARDLTAEQAAARRGLNDKLFTDTASTVDEPIEVCGLMGEVEWLTRMTCADGSRPWGTDFDRAHDARRGSTMRNAPGPCGMMPVDVYAVPCPEKSYEVYMDLYMCGPGEDLSRGMRRP